MIKVRFDHNKALEVLLYIAQSYPDMYKALKLVYFADKKHLEDYGRLICGDTYIAMRSGPVPSGMYDMMKYARDDARYFIRNEQAIEHAFRLDNSQLIPLRGPDLDYLSASDIECLNYALEHYGALSNGDLKQASHDAAYHSAGNNDVIELEAVATSVRDGDALVEYLKH